jgi:aspartate/methionine/tyrosine aminotransferase
MVALKEGEPIIARSLSRYRKARNFLVAELQKIPRVSVASPAGTMYAFVKVEGVDDSLAFCKKLVKETGLGLAPGSAFGPEGEGFVRWCFAASEERLAEGLERLRRGLKT